VLKRLFVFIAATCLVACSSSGGSKGSDGSNTESDGGTDTTDDGDTGGTDLTTTGEPPTGDSTSGDDGGSDAGVDTGPGGDGSGSGDDETDGGTVDGGSGGPCAPATLVAPTTDFFADISKTSGIQSGNHDPAPPKPLSINDHSRLGFADINGDGFDDIVMHSLFPNPQKGVPFEHLVFLNNGDGTFTDVSDDSNLRGVQAGFFAFGDVDNDGDQDVFAGLDVPLTGSNHQILLNNGGGYFTKVTNSGVEGPAGQTVAANAVFFDADGDGVLDLFVGNGHTSYAAPDMFFIGNGDGTFKNMNSALKVNPAHPTNGCVVCDYDDDGDLDIFVSTYGVSAGLGLNILWENDGASFTNVAVARGYASQAGGNYWMGLADTPEPGKGAGQYMGSNGFGLDCGDINNDGRMDVFLSTISHVVDGAACDQACAQSPGGQNCKECYKRKWSDPSQLLINQGGTTGFKNEWLARSLPFNEGDIDAAMIDFDNDGLLDLSLSRESKYEKNYSDDEQKGWFGLMRQLADGNFESVGTKSGINALGVEQLASLTTCSSDAQCTTGNEKCLKDKCRIPCSSNAECVSEHEVCHTGGFCRALNRMKRAQNHAWSDIDRDGDLDLLVGGRDQGGGRPNFLFRNDIGSQNRWLAISVVGDGSKVNRDGVGTRVSLKFADRSLTREVKLSRGMHNSMDTKVLHFGLGELPCDFEMKVRWPDGTEASFSPDDTGQNRYLTLTYPDSLEVQ
jgi:hypothetical protein